MKAVRGVRATEVHALGGEVRLLMVAAPGGGKGTQGQRLAAKYGTQHDSLGEDIGAAVVLESGAPGGRPIRPGHLRL